MIRRSIIFVALAIAAVPAMAQDVTLTEAYIAYRNIRNPDGSITRTEGGYIPIKIVPIKASDMAYGKSHRGRQNRDKARSNRFGGPGMFSSSQSARAYQNTGGLFYAVDNTFSALDDLVLIEGSENKSWIQVTFALHLSTANRTGIFLVRWRVWETFVPGHGAGVSAFEDEVVDLDVGFYLDLADFPAELSSFILIADVSAYPGLLASPSTSVFLAQQFREPHVVGFPPREDGEGQFIPDIWNVFADAGPQIGSSEDVFFWDFLPSEGIYDETEVDTLDPADAADFLFAIDIAGQTLELTPSSFTWIRGGLQSGNLGSLWFDDGNYNVAKAGFVLFAGESPAQIVVESFVSSTDILGLRFDVVAKTNTPGLNQRVELWNYTTGGWDIVSDGPATTTDSTVLSFVSNPTDYVDGTLVLRSKVSWYRAGFTLLWPWSISVDQVHWVVTTP